MYLLFLLPNIVKTQNPCIRQYTHLIEDFLNKKLNRLHMDFLQKFHFKKVLHYVLLLQCGAKKLNIAGKAE